MNILSDPLSLPRNDAYKEAIEELMDIPGLSKIKPIMKEYFVELFAIDFKLQITVRISYDAIGDRKWLKHHATEDILDIKGLSKIQSLMYKYNISFFMIDKDFNFSAKRTKTYCPLKH